MNGEIQLTEDTVRQYLDEASREPLLTREQEADLAKRILAGRAARHLLMTQEIVAVDEDVLEEIKRDGEQSRERFIDANLLLAASYAAKNYRHALELPDRIQYANQGVIKAVDRFDHTKGYKFSTYAWGWIRQSLQRGAANSSRTVRLPNGVQEILKKKKKIEEEALRRDEKLTDAEIAKRLDISVQRLREVVLAPQYLDSLDKPVGRDGSDERKVADFVPDARSLNIQEDVVEDLWTSQVMKEAYDILNDKERFIIGSRHGLYDGVSHTLQETGDAMGLTRERVRQIQVKAEKKLRKHFESKEKATKEAA